MGGEIRPLFFFVQFTQIFGGTSSAWSSEFCQLTYYTNFSTIICARLPVDKFPKVWYTIIRKRGKYNDKCRII